MDCLCFCCSFFVNICIHGNNGHDYDESDDDHNENYNDSNECSLICQAGGDDGADSAMQHTPHHPGISPVVPSETPRAPSSGANTVKTAGEGSTKGETVSLCVCVCVFACGCGCVCV